MQAECQKSPLFQFLHRKLKVRVGERFILQGEMPPLAVDGLEAVAEHCRTQDHAVAELLLGDGAAGRGRFPIIDTRLGIAAEVGMALLAEPVEGAAHIDLLLRGHVEKGEIDGGAARVTTLRHNIPLIEKHAFIHLGIEVAFHCGDFFNLGDNEPNIRSPYQSCIYPSRH